MPIWCESLQGCDHRTISSKEKWKPPDSPRSETELEVVEAEDPRPFGGDDVSPRDSVYAVSTMRNFIQPSHADQTSKGPMMAAMNHALGTRNRIVVTWGTSD
jgi:hypothetical protein